MSLEDKTFTWPSPPEQPSKEEILGNIENVRNTYLIMNIDFMDKHEEMKTAEKEYKADEENLQKKEKYLEAKGNYEELRDDISHLELMETDPGQEPPIPDEWHSFRNRQDFVDALRARGFTDEDFEQLFPPKPEPLPVVIPEPEPEPEPTQPIVTPEPAIEPQSTPPITPVIEPLPKPVPKRDDDLTLGEMEDKLKYAKDTIRMYETAYWEEKIKQRKGLGNAENTTPGQQVETQQSTSSEDTSTLVPPDARR